MTVAVTEVENRRCIQLNGFRFEKKPRQNVCLSDWTQIAVLFLKHSQNITVILHLSLPFLLFYNCKNLLQKLCTLLLHSLHMSHQRTVHSFIFACPLCIKVSHNRHLQHPAICLMAIIFFICSITINHCFLVKRPLNAAHN